MKSWILALTLPALSLASSLATECERAVMRECDHAHQECKAGCDDAECLRVCDIKLVDCIEVGFDSCADRNGDAEWAACFDRCSSILDARSRRCCDARCACEHGGQCADVARVCK